MEINEDDYQEKISILPEGLSPRITLELDKFFKGDKSLTSMFVSGEPGAFGLGYDPKLDSESELLEAGFLEGEPVVATYFSSNYEIAEYLSAKKYLASYDETGFLGGFLI